MNDVRYNKIVHFVNMKGLNMKINERILSAWLKMILAVDSERVVLELSYNEAIICHELYSNSDKEITATELCSFTNMQKSLMNRTLNSLEEKKLVERKRSIKDKRKIVIHLVNNPDSLYMKQHKKTLEYVDKIIEHLGNEKSEEIINIFEKIASIAQEEKI